MKSGSEKKTRLLSLISSKYMAYGSFKHGDKGVVIHGSHQYHYGRVSSLFLVPPRFNTWVLIKLTLFGGKEPLLVSEHISIKYSTLV